MHPQPDMAIRTIALSLLHQQHAEDNLRKVAQIERVMHLQRCGQKLCNRRLVHLQGAGDNLFGQALHLLGVVVLLQLPLQDGGEDPGHVVIVQIGKADHKQVPKHPWCDECSATARWSHGSKQEHVGQGSEWVGGILAIIPTTMRWISYSIDHLPQDLDGWLGAKLLLVGHIQVIHHDDSQFARWRAIDTLPSSVQLGIHQVLCLCAFGLRREANGDGHVVVLVQGHQRLHHISGLASTCWTAKEELQTIANAMAEQVAVADVIHGLHDDVLHT
mmetsp:Transcript_24722/g.57417  ORF Transcript_24722/g.57417 Transcript_24722/m.57417 type:complete len:274 (-) Transcript_24722:237-1058(-)